MIFKIIKKTYLKNLKNMKNILHFIKYRFIKNKRTNTILLKNR